MLIVREYANFGTEEKYSTVGQKKKEVHYNYISQAG